MTELNLKFSALATPADCSRRAEAWPLIRLIVLRFPCSVILNRSLSDLCSSL